MAPLWMGFNYLKAIEPLQGDSLLSSQEVDRDSFDRPEKEERLGRSWSHLVVLKPGSLEWESSTLWDLCMSIMEFQYDNIQKFCVR